MADNLKIGATVDTGAIAEGFTTVQDLTQKVTQKMAIQFEEASTRTKAAMRGISDDVKVMAESVSAESLKVAEATKAQTAAMADLRRAQTIAKDANVEESVSTSLLAAAQQKAAAASVEVAAAKKEEAKAVAEAAEEEALSQNIVIAAFQRAAIAARESLGEIQARLIETAEAGGLEAEGIRASFAGLASGIFGGLLVAGFAGEFLDGVTKVNVELGHLSEKTQISVSSLSGLQQIVKEMGGDFQPVETALIRMQRAQVMAIEGGKAQQLAFSELGISVQELEHLSPEQLFVRLSGAIHDVDQPAKAATSAIQLFGRGGAALIPIFRQQGTELEANMQRLGRLTGVTEESVEASERWTRNMAKLHAAFQSFGNFAIENIHYVGDALMGVKGIADGLGASVVTVIKLATGGISAMLTELAGAGRVLLDITTGNFGRVQADLAATQQKFSEGWKSTFGDISAAWKDVAKDFTGTPSTPQKKERREGDTDLSELEGAALTGRGGNKAHKQAEEALRADEDELNQRKLDHQVGIDEEIRFWDAKLAVAKKGSDLYKLITAKLAPLVQEQDSKKPPKLTTETDDGSIKEAEREFIEGQQRELAAAKEAAKQESEAFREAQQEKVRLAEENYRSIEQDSQFEVQMGRITAEQRIAILRQAAAQEQQIKLQAAQTQEQLDLSNAARYQQDLNKEVEATREYTARIKQLNQQAATESMQQWEKLFTGITTQMNKVLIDMINGHKNLAQQLAQVWNGIAQNFIQNILKMAEQYLVGLALQRTGQLSAIEHAAATAAANTYASVSAIPIVGPVLAPPAAAAAFAAVLAFESFDKGGVVQGGGGRHVPVLAKAGERVLTPQQNTNFESLVNHSSASQQSVTNNHLHYNGQVNAYDRRGMRETLRSHSGDILDIFKDGVRNGQLALP